MKKSMRHKALALTLIAATVLALPGCSGCGEEETVVSAEPESQAFDHTIEWNGHSYKYNNDLTNILFLGIDKREEFEDEYMPGQAGQSDSIMILSLNDETKEATILQINRNTMTELDVFREDGSFYFTKEGQVCLQYAYSIGGAASCQASKKTISEMLYEFPIDAYLSLDLAGVPEINDALGGVDVTMDQDYTWIDPSFTEGTTVHLEGDAAQAYVQDRTDEFNSVQDRMDRQCSYVTAMIQTMKSQSGSSLYDILEPYMDSYVVTDMDADQMNSLKNYTYLTDEILTAPGEETQGDIYEEYYLDEDALQEMLITHFYKQVD